MKCYLKRGGEDFEFGPVGLMVDQAKLDDGFEIVDAIPQDILDRCMGGKSYVAVNKVDELEKRIAALEARTR